MKRSSYLSEGASVTSPAGPGTVVGHNVPSDTVVVKLAADGRAHACPKASVCGSRKAYEEMHVKPKSAGRPGRTGELGHRSPRNSA